MNDTQSSGRERARQSARHTETNAPKAGEHASHAADRYLRALDARVPDALSLALAAGLAEHLDADVLSSCARRSGGLWAMRLAPRFECADSMAELIAAMNDYWAELHWGWVELEQRPQRLRMRHRLLPLARIYGEEHVRWSVGLIEGFYEEVFRQLGADASVRVRLIDGTEDGDDPEFEVSA